MLKKKRGSLDRALKYLTIAVYDNEVEKWIDKVVNKIYNSAMSGGNVEAPHYRLLSPMEIGEEELNDEIEKIREILEELNCVEVLLLTTGTGGKGRSIESGMSIDDFISILYQEASDRLSRLFDEYKRDLGEFDEYDEFDEGDEFDEDMGPFDDDEL
jgi:hypothetical protein